MWKKKSDAKASRRNRGRAAKLSPRVPAYRKLPRLPVKDFATDGVLKALNINVNPLTDDSPDTDIFEEVMSKQNVDKKLREIIADYCADAAQQQHPKAFRRGLKSLGRCLDNLKTCFPSPTDTLTEALDREIESRHEDNYGFSVDETLRHLESLQKAATAISDAEGGSGREADRAQHRFIHGLANIFEDYWPGKKAGKSWHNDPIEGPRGAFAELVMAVNLEIPEKYRLRDLPNLFKAMAKFRA